MTALPSTYMDQKSIFPSCLEEACDSGERFAFPFHAFCFSACVVMALLSGCGIGITPFGKLASPANPFPEEVQASPPEQDAEVSSAPTGVQEVVELEKPLSGELLTEEADKFHWVFQTDVRAYRSSNFARSNTTEDGAAATEYTAVGRLIFPKIQDAPLFSTLSSSLTLLGQRAYFGQYAIDSSDSTDISLKALDYEFRSVMLDAETTLASDWILALSIGYHELLNFRGYEKLYHAVAPSVSFGRDYPVAGDGILNLKVSADYALTKTYSQYEVPGVFDDAGDNLRTSLNLTLAKSLGSSGRLYLTPSASLMRTVYTKPDSIGRVDYLVYAEFAAFYRVMPWLYLRAFGNYQDKTGNDKAMTLLEDYAEYENWDAGLGLGASISF